MNGNHHFRAHFSHNIGRKIAYQSTVDKHLVVPPDGIEQPRNGHCGAHRLRQAAIAENDFLAAHKIGGDAAIGNRQVVKRFQISIRQRFAINQQINLVPGIQTCSSDRPFFRPS